MELKIAEIIVSVNVFEMHGLMDWETNPTWSGVKIRFPRRKFLSTPLIKGQVC